MEQRRRGSEAKVLLDDQALLEHRNELTGQIEARTQTLDGLARSPAERSMAWMSELATPEERTLLEELDAKRALVNAHMEGPEKTKWLDRIDRLEGTLFWQIADGRAGRTRALTRVQSENSGLLVDLDERIARVANAEAEFAAGVETDFVLFSDRADMLTANVTRALTAREVALAGELKRGMAREMKEVRQYLLVTRIGIARATDELAMTADTVEGE